MGYGWEVKLHGQEVLREVYGSSKLYFCIWLAAHGYDCIDLLIVTWLYRMLRLLVDLHLLALLSLC